MSTTYTNVTFRKATNEGIIIWLSLKFTELTVEEIKTLRERFRYEQADIDSSDELDLKMTLADIQVWANNEDVSNSFDSDGFI